MKTAIRKFIRGLGWDLHRLSPSSSNSAQLCAALDYVGSNVVFDIGANIGQFAQELRSVGFTGKIISFEPQSSAHGKLSIAASSDSAWIVHSRVAVGDREGEIKINIAGNSVSSSVLPMLDAHSSAAIGSAYVSNERAPLIRLDSVAAQYIDPDSRCFIKIDTQGFEWQVLEGANDTLCRSRGVILELSLVALYEGQRPWRDVIDRMEAEGFSLWAIQKVFTDSRTGRSLQVDAIFLRE